MHKLIFWIKRHYIAIGIAMMCISAILFCILYQINQMNSPGEILVDKNGIYISLHTAPIDVWIILAVVIGAGGIILTGYSLLKKREETETLNSCFNQMLKRK